VNEDLRLASVLETVLYYPSEQQDEMKRFYEDVLGLESLGLGRWSLAFRLGPGVVPASPPAPSVPNSEIRC
jgi:hypothetical protein